MTAHSYRHSPHHPVEQAEQTHDLKDQQNYERQVPEQDQKVNPGTHT
ncbi:MAG: hypothetical protein NZ750_06835 [Anaerolineae bacterium]|nr:hypothetical protein [Anaerolineae bacterium]